MTSIIEKNMDSHFKSMILAIKNGKPTEELASKAARENPCATVALLRHYKDEKWAAIAIRIALEDTLARQLWGSAE